MSIEILMPALSPTMTEGNLVKWLKNEGDVIKSGQVLCEIETDKATMEVEAVDEGILGKILVPAGSEGVQVNTLIALILEDGENASSLKADPKAAIPEIKAQAVAGQPVITKSEILKSSPIFATPLAKRIASEKGISLGDIQGSGPKGRIIKADLDQSPVQNVKSQSLAQSPQADFEDIKVSLMRKTVAKRLTESKNTVPHFYLSIDCEIDALLKLRAELKDSIKISVNDILIKICAKALQEVPKVNATWHDSYIRYYKNVDISVAVAIDGGLVTPILFNAEKLSLSDISTQVKALAEKARAGKLQPREYEGGTFTISNLGMYGVKSFSAIINPPQGCILAVGAGEKRMIVKNDEPKIATVMTVTLSVDHRTVDGALGAEFLQSFKKYVENPVLALV